MYFFVALIGIFAGAGLVIVSGSYLLFLNEAIASFEMKHWMFTAYIYASLSLLCFLSLVAMKKMRRHWKHL